MASTKNIDLKQEYDKIVEENSGFLFTRFSGLSVEKTMELKTILRNENFQYKIIKNTVFQKAVKDVEHIDIPDEYFKGNIALVFGNKNLPIVAKKLKNYSKENKQAFSFAAFFEGCFFDSSQVDSVATLPTRDESLASIARMIQAPVSNIASFVSKVISSTMNAIEQVAKKNKN